MKYIVYVLQNDQGRIYIGHTNDLSKRLLSHNDGKNQWTSNKGPWKIIYKESYATRSEAMRREKFFKTGVGRKFLNERLMGS